MDNLVPVQDSGDEDFKDGQKVIKPTVEQQKQADELIKKIAEQKQQELKIGDPEDLMKLLRQDTPDGAIYRALLLQQLMQNQKQPVQEKKKDEPGFLWKVGVGAAKLLGHIALRYLTYQALFKSYDIYTKGPKVAWNEWVAQHGVAKSADFAEQCGDATAAVGSDILKRNVDFKDLSDAQQKAMLSYAKEKGFYDNLNTNSATFSLKSMFEKDGSYTDAIPKGDNPDDYKKVWSYILDTGGSNATTIPIAKSEIGDNLYNNMFKMGTLRTLITPDDNWFTGNSFVRSLDNGAFHFADLSGRNQLKRDAYVDNINNYLPPSKQIITDPEIAEKKIDDSINVAKANIENILGNTKSGAWFASTKFDVNPDKLDKTIDGILGMKRNYASAEKVFKSLNPNTSKGVTMPDLLTFITKAVETKMGETDSKTRVKIYEGLLKDYSKMSVGSFSQPYFNPSYDADIGAETLSNAAQIAGTAGVSSALITTGAMAGPTPPGIAMMVSGVVFAALFHDW